MNDMLSLLANGYPNVKFELTGADLREFADFMISKTVNEITSIMQSAEADRLMPRESVKKLLCVCDTTLWLWDKRNYLKCVKVGGKVMYRQSDVNRILQSRPIGEAISKQD